MLCYFHENTNNTCHMMYSAILHKMHLTVNRFPFVFMIVADDQCL